MREENVAGSLLKSVSLAECQQSILVDMYNTSGEALVVIYGLTGQM